MLRTPNPAYITLYISFLLNKHWFKCTYKYVWSMPVPPSGYSVCSVSHVTVSSWDFFPHFMRFEQFFLVALFHRSIEEHLENISLFLLRDSVAGLKMRIWISCIWTENKITLSKSTKILLVLVFCFVLHGFVLFIKGYLPPVWIAGMKILSARNLSDSPTFCIC